jgi:hypothetical protein
MLALFESWAGLPDGSLANTGWVAHGVYRDGELAGIGALQGTEIHFATNPAWRGRLMSRRAVRRFLAPLLEQHSYLTTRVPHGDSVAPRFIERLGFAQTWRDSGHTYYMLTAVPFSKET